MRAIRCVSIVVCGILVTDASSLAQPVGYTDETAFMNALSLQGFVAIQEGFEDDAAWGAVRSSGGTNTAPSVSSLGIAWSSSSANNEITTGSGAALTGNWGLFSLPHGDYANGITDGWRGTPDQLMVAIGGWIDTNTVPAGIALYLDGDLLNPVDFGGSNALTGAHQFFGVIDPAGFFLFDFRETEGTIGDQKFIFSDDFTFAFSGQLLDCNENGVADGLDIVNETSDDCNNNIVPDECEIDVNSTAPGGPFYCTEDCAADCNDNGTIDDCEVVAPDVYSSGQLIPIGNGSPQSYTIVSPPMTRADVILDFTAYANLGGGPDHLSVDINGVAVGEVFGLNGSDCPEMAPDADQLVVPMTTFNNAVNGGDAVINMVATVEVDPFGCAPETYVTVEATLFIPSAADLNGNGTPDECEQVIPTVSSWGMFALVLLVLIAGTMVFRRGYRSTGRTGLP